MAELRVQSDVGGPVVDLRAFDGAAFDLDGVVTRTAGVHAAAWKQLFDTFLAAHAAAGAPFVPFDSQVDYLRYVDGKPRNAGVRDFLASRGISLPEGSADDPAGRDTVVGLGKRKNACFLAMLHSMGVQVFEGSVALLRALRAAGLRTAVVSSSENTAGILSTAGIADLFDVCVDGLVSARLGLAGKPSGDTFVHAATELGIAPSRLFGVEDAIAGVAAIRAAGYGLVIGVDRGGNATALLANGADVVVRDLGELRLQGPRCDDRQPGLAATDANGLPATPGSDPAWRVVEEGFTLTREHEVESLMAIGNGYVGSRASLAEGSRLSSPATFVAGVYETAPPRLAMIPDWTHLSVSVEGRPLSLEDGTILEHRRTLDMRQAIALRHWRHQDAAGRISRICGMRFASAADRHLLVQSITFQAENYSGVVSVDATIDAPLVQQAGSGVRVALAPKTRSFAVRDAREIASDGAAAGTSFRVAMGDVYRLDRVIAVLTSREEADPEARAQALADAAMASGVPAVLDAHIRTWSSRWEAGDLRVDGDLDAQRALRFAIYHLCSAANPDDERTSIGARALTGPAYAGHVFWDTESFMLPFFTLTWPEAARAMLLYRHRTLPAARRRAAHIGCSGALYAWESADSGDDVTPPLVAMPGGAIVRVRTGEQEQHISADVARAVWRYWQATQDVEFLLTAGAEILVETARFWASRATRGPDGKHHINGVIGPDEYHEGVDDNAYTNAMARWNLEAGAQLVDLATTHWPERWRGLAGQLGLGDDEPAAWRAVSANLYTGLDERSGLIEQFRGYFALEDIDLSAHAPRNAPIDVMLGRERVQRSQVIKQADVVMLLHEFWDAYPPRVREANFRYYAPRCAHGSSLSPAIHALVAARLGDTGLAMRYFREAMEIDLADNFGNAAGGVHAGAMGGLWQAAVFGFAGLSLGEGGPSVQPNLPPHWGGLSFAVRWRGKRHVLSVGAPGASQTRETPQ